MSRDEIFESYADNAFDPETKENSLIWKRKWYDANFKKFFPKKRTARILDIGPGLGELLLTERDWGYTNCFAVDISPSIVQYCKKFGLDCEKTDDTVAWLRQHRGSFDLITTLDVFEHIPQETAVGFLKACKEALSKDGVFILQVPNIQSAESYLHRYNDLTHVFGYSQHTLEQLISIVGFETVRFYPFEEYPGDDMDTKMTRRLRSIYWKCLRMNRKITHNLEPEILTPELFVVMAKKKCELPDNSIKEEFSDGIVSLKDIETYLERMGIRSEAFEQLYKILDLERLIHTINDYNSCRFDELERSLKKCDNKLLEQSERWEECSSKLEEYSKSLSDINNILEKESRKLQEFACLSKEYDICLGMLEKRLEEQNTKLDQFVDHHMEQVNQHHAWMSSRLDYLEMKVEKMDQLLMNIRYPFRTLRKRIFSKINRE